MPVTHTSTQVYNQYFESPRYYNMLLQQWLRLFPDRSKGAFIFASDAIVPCVYCPNKNVNISGIAALIAHGAGRSVVPRPPPLPRFELLSSRYCIS